MVTQALIIMRNRQEPKPVRGPVKGHLDVDALHNHLSNLCDNISNFPYFAFIVACYDLHGIALLHVHWQPDRLSVFCKLIMLPLLSWALPSHSHKGKETVGHELSLEKASTLKSHTQC
jgi:hypothetical protein